ncbi:tyrosine-protein phosphatase [Sphingobium sp. V4]|uniref:tyrosine-protein phosphatase n=1 Tax=Sphingobium sp. V4 TaxID=3038927 RepID=UPI002557E17E|nr:tyrosine-protein phosphatase [Sphingobium sp. V4]WIW87945.1 tyrosine-protein phosphatase [Sphingobium sp. V4]
MSGEVVMAGDRLPLASAFNLRDFGGHATADGRTVRRKMLYRSGTMALLTDRDATQLRAFGIRAICDFRRPNEREAEPTSWHGADVDYYCRDYRETSGVLGEVLRAGAATAEDMRAAMIALYRSIAIDHAESYRAMFRQMLAGRLPILINCAAGKDRTGVGAALILAALGVPRAAIVKDYLLTNDHADWDWRLAQGESRLAAARRDRADVIAPVLHADAAYLDALFETLDADHGGIDCYMEDVLCVDAPAREALREALLIP